MAGSPTGLWYLLGGHSGDVSDRNWPIAAGVNGPQSAKSGLFRSSQKLAKRGRSQCHWEIVLRFESLWETGIDSLWL